MALLRYHGAPNGYLHANRMLNNMIHTFLSFFNYSKLSSLAIIFSPDNSLAKVWNIRKAD